MSRPLYVYREGILTASFAGAVSTVMTLAIAWVLMFVGHLIAIKLFTWMEPRLPHLEQPHVEQPHFEQPPAP